MPLRYWLFRVPFEKAIRKDVVVEQLERKEDFNGHSFLCHVRFSFPLSFYLHISVSSCWSRKSKVMHLLTKGWRRGGMKNRRVIRNILHWIFWVRFIKVLGEYREWEGEITFVSFPAFIFFLLILLLLLLQRSLELSIFSFVFFLVFYLFLFVLLIKICHCQCQ